jgi:hypothetical protein
MYSYTSVLLYIVLAEVLRRWIKILLTALTGPLSKVPGPFIYKFSSLPWARIVLQGNQINESPKLFAKFGDVVRIGMFPTHINSQYSHKNSPRPGRGLQQECMLQNPRRRRLKEGTGI